MKIRKRILPKTPQDIAATVFLIMAIPITFWFEIFVVLADIHDTSSSFYIAQVVLGIFLVLNISLNMLAIMMYDTSTSNEMIVAPKNLRLTDEPSDSWRICTTCEAVAPPRSWHCSVCNVCILKRDHHCMFTGCCIGHKNHRFFMIMIFYLFIATAYSSVYNTYYIWIFRGVQFRNWISYVKMVFPLAMLMVDSSFDQYYLLIYLINIVGCCMTLVLLIYHLNLIFSGKIVHEKRSIGYDMGSKMDNLKVVLGKRWYLTFLSPFFKSELTHDGIDWDSVRDNAPKNK